MVSKRGSATRRSEKASHDDGYALGLVMIEHRTEDALGLVVLELDVQAVLDPDLHLYLRVRVCGRTERVHPNVAFFGYVCHSPRDADAHKVTADGHE